MCGINGVIFKSNKDEVTVKNTLTVMNNLIIHRGPDDEGSFIATNTNYSIGLAMRRLSIIDLSTGHQPMFSKDNKITIVFNGEIYNYQLLRQQLQSEGIQFQTTSDTEVILKLYENYGVKAFQMLDGMYGLSIYDSNIDKVYIARDFFGEKPLYFYNSTNEFFWASELKSIINNLHTKPRICKEGLNLYFKLTYIPAPYTIYENIFKLEANHYLEYDLKTFNYSIFPIHNEIEKHHKNISFNDAKLKVHELVYKSVESRSIADVPLGTFLSGGVDSSIVSYCLSDMSSSKIDTFSIGFEKASYDETDKSRIVSKMINSNHHEFIISEKDLKNNIDSILLNFDEPFADSSSLPTYLVANKTKAHVKVALTGDGGDEIFGGYNKYYIGKLNSKYTKIVPKKLHQGLSKFSDTVLKRKDDNRGFKYKLNKLIKAIDYSDHYYWDIISLGFDDTSLTSTLLADYQISNIFDYYKTKTKIKSPTTLNDFRTIDRHISLEGDMLVKVDRTSMLNSLECRAPFLNRDLYNITSQLPENYLIHKWSKKHILKEAFKEVFPNGFLEKSKQGFGVPVGDWLREGLRNELLQFTEKGFLEKQDIFNVYEINTLVNNHLQGKIDNSFKVWTYFCFQKWYTNTYLQ